MAHFLSIFIPSLTTQLYITSHLISLVQRIALPNTLPIRHRNLLVLLSMNRRAPIRSPGPITIPLHVHGQARVRLGDGVMAAYHVIRGVGAVDAGAGLAAVGVSDG